MLNQKPNSTPETVIYYYDGFSKPIFIGRTLKELQDEISVDTKNEAIKETISVGLPELWKENFTDLNVILAPFNLHVKPSLTDMVERLSLINIHKYGFDNGDEYLDLLIQEAIDQENVQFVNSMTE